jgi:hypothetical protein
LDRKPPDSAACEGEKSIANRRRGRRHAWFSNAAMGIPAGYEMHLDPRHLVHSHEPVIVEVALNDPTASAGTSTLEVLPLILRLYSGISFLKYI